MNFHSSYLEELAATKSKGLSTTVRAMPAEKMFRELLNYKIYNDFIIPLFDGENFDQSLIIFDDEITCKHDLEESLG